MVLRKPSDGGSNRHKNWNSMNLRKPGGVSIPSLQQLDKKGLLKEYQVGRPDFFDFLK